MKPEHSPLLTRLDGNRRSPGPLQHTSRIAFSLLLVLSHPLWAATIIVDETTCTLVDAITAANTDTATGGCPAGSWADTIELTSNVTLIDNGLPEVNTNITIEGGGFAIERDANAPPFWLFGVGWYYYDQQGDYTQGSLSLDNVTLRNGTPAISVGGGNSLTLTNSTITADYPAPPDVAAIYVSGIADVRNTTISGGHFAGIQPGDYGGYVRLTDSTVSGNTFGVLAPGHVANCTVSGNEIGVAVGGGTVSLTNSTISGNDIGTLSWASWGPYSKGRVILANSTLSGNGVGVYIQESVGTNPGEAHLQNTIVGNSSTSDCFVGAVIVSGEVNDLGNNFADDETCGAGFGDITPGVDFDTNLADNGGPTLTHALLPGSVAIDAAGVCGLPTDQRGFLRWDGACDSGSFEYGAIQDDEDEDEDEDDDRRNGPRGSRLFRDGRRTPSDRIRGLEPR